MSVAKVIEISCESSEGFEDAIRNGLERAGKTLKGIQGAWVKEQQVRLRDGVIESYRVNLRVTFELEG